MVHEVSHIQMFFQWIEEHFPLLVFFFGAAGGFIVWLWGETVGRDRATKDYVKAEISACRDEVVKDSERSDALNTADHSRIEKQIEAVAKTQRQMLNYLLTGTEPEEQEDEDDDAQA